MPRDGGDNQESVRHTEEPWSYDMNRSISAFQTQAAIHVGSTNKGNCLALVLLGGPGATSPRVVDVEANARRIVACVNACAGIPTESLNAVGRLMNAARIRLQRGHNDTCQHAIQLEYACNCGHDELGEALEELGGASNETR